MIPIIIKRGGKTMYIKFENKTKQLVILRLNSGQTLFIDPGTFPGEIGDEEISNNTMVKKLVDRGVIAVNSIPAVKNRTLEHPLEQSPASAPISGVEKPDQEKNDKKQKKSKTKGGK
jgi:hypothetical protein